jgi:hypothetical protein
LCCIAETKKLSTLPFLKSNSVPGFGFKAYQIIKINKIKQSMEMLGTITITMFFTLAFILGSNEVKLVC